VSLLMFDFYATPIWDFLDIVRIH